HAIIRLLGGSNDAEGRVEVLYGGSWGTVCDHGWDLRDARVVCRMLGFDGALDAPVSVRFGQGSGPILDQVGCDGTEDSLLDCVHAGTGLHSCTQRTVAGAVCYSGAFPEPFPIRLVDGSSGNEGRVEVMYGGSWGTVCDDEWDLNDARVICRMLGFEGALDAPGSATFGQGSGDILLDSIGCTGTEDNLAECIHKGIGDHDCAHTEDAGVVCYSGSK
ncbi:deleted in malignant brain tumors 1 protein-like, partial [Lytechinus variegatus]|uniref:deleted in malignant brain tumors 1 protein-like n=1 Tax=Lytechinus variegatus TaxID=7654 RepID=UPI001BB157CF